MQPCPKACLKFDGFAPDGKRVIIRDCAAEGQDTNECVDSQEYSGAEGQMCVCNAANCNGGARHGGGGRDASAAVVFLGAAVAAAVAAGANFRWRS